MFRVGFSTPFLSHFRTFIFFGDGFEVHQQCYTDMPCTDLHMNCTVLRKELHTIKSKKMFQVLKKLVFWYFCVEKVKYIISVRILHICADGQRSIKYSSRLNQTQAMLVRGHFTDVS